MRVVVVGFGRRTVAFAVFAIILTVLTPQLAAAVAPTATNMNAAETYTEDTALNLIDIVVSDVDSTTTTATLTLSNTAAGSLTTGTSGAVTSTYNGGTGVWTASGAIADVNTLLSGVTFVPAANFNSNFTIATNVDDGSGGVISGAKNVSGIAVNDAPVLDASKGPTLGTLLEDAGPPAGAVGVLVNSLVDLTVPSGGLDNVTDPDAGAVTGVAIIAADANLSCFYSLNGGTTWNSIGAVSTAAARLLAADADNRIYCQPGLNANGSFPGALTIRAWDQTSGIDGGVASTSSNGGATAFSTATDTVSLTVTAVNDPPTATNMNAAETYTEDTALNLIDIVVSDVDNATTTATLTLSNTAAGTLTTGTAGTVTSTFDAGTGVWTASGSIPDVNALLAALTFVPALNFNANFTIATNVSDGTASVSGTKNITGIAVNDAPVAAADSITLNQGAATTSLVGGASSVLANDVDVDSPSLTAQLVTAPSHSSTFILNTNGSFLYAHDDSSSATDSFVYRACDGGTPNLCSADTLVTINVNLKPITGCTVPNQAVIEGDVVSLDLSGILVDPESQTLTFGATGLPSGLSMNTTGLVTGTVSAGTHTGSPYTVTITAWDTGAAAGTRDLIMQVLALGELVFRNNFDDPADATACH